jgi:hypothetical protein
VTKRNQKKIPEFSSCHKILPEEFWTGLKILREGFSSARCGHG